MTTPNKLDRKLNKLATDYFGCDVGCGGCSKFVSQIKKIIFNEIFRKLTDLEIKIEDLNYFEQVHKGDYYNAGLLDGKKVTRDLLK